MADNHSIEQRSYNMSRIRSTDTKPELLVRKFLFALGFRYRLNVSGLQGKPDIVLKKYKTVIFINGCFWHGHEGCRYYVIPKTKTEWWLNKISRTKNRDADAYAALVQAGWNVIVVWECELRPDRQEEKLSNLVKQITPAL